jgi:predicted nucleotidyltransferase
MMKFSVIFVKTSFMETQTIEILNNLSCRLKERFPGNIKNVILFGSQTDGKAGPDSDYDILIILKEKADWKTEREISDICYEIELKYDILTDTHILSEPELSTLRGRQPVFINAITNGVYA